MVILDKYVFIIIIIIIYKCKDIFGGLTLRGVLLVSKRRIWVTMHFSELIKLQFGKEHHTIHCTLKLFLQILLIKYLWKMLGYPQFSFWISITIAKICFSCIFINWIKNNFELVGAVLKVCYSEKQRWHYLVFITSLWVVKTLKYFAFVHWSPSIRLYG